MSNIDLKTCVLFLVLTASYEMSLAQQKTELLIRAEKSLIDGDTLAALNQLQQVLVVYPQSFAATMRLAEVYYDLHEYQTAVQYCNIARDITDNFQNQALEKLQPSNKPTKEVIEEQTKKIERYASDRADILHLKGLIRSKQSRPDDAIEAYKSALEIKTDQKILIDLALTYLEVGHLYDALGLLHQAKALNPTDYKADFNLGNVHYKVQNLDSALFYYQITQQKAPELKWPYFYSGLIYTKKAQYKEAIGQYTNFIKLDSTNEELYFRRAVLWSELRKWKLALNDWNTVLEKNPDNAESWRNKGLSHFQLGAYDSAIYAFDEALKILPEEAYTYINRGYSYYLIDNPKQALADLNKGLEGLPKYHLGFYFRALVHLQLRKKKKACQDIKKAVGLGMKERDIDKKLLRRCF